MTTTDTLQALALIHDFERDACRLNMEFALSAAIPDDLQARRNAAVNALLVAMGQAPIHTPRTPSSEPAGEGGSGDGQTSIQTPSPSDVEAGATPAPEVAAGRVERLASAPRPTATGPQTTRT